LDWICEALHQLLELSFAISALLASFLNLQLACLHNLIDLNFHLAAHVAILMLQKFPWVLMVELAHRIYLVRLPADRCQGFVVSSGRLTPSLHLQSDLAHLHQELKM
jgi:hypothetical protein